MNKNTRFRLSLLLLVWMTCYLIIYYFLGVFDSPYFSLGPNPSFVFLGVVVDTWPKWSGLISFQIIGTCAEMIVGDMIWPWITTQIQDEDKKELPCPPWMCRWIVLFQFFYADVKGIFDIFLSLSQVDLAIVNIVCGQLVSVIYTLPMWLRGKEYRKGKYLEQGYVLINEEQ